MSMLMKLCKHDNEIAPHLALHVEFSAMLKIMFWEELVGLLCLTLAQ